MYGGGCRTHLTDGESRAYRAAVAKAKRRALWEAHEYARREPACWQWPLPEPHSMYFFQRPVWDAEGKGGALDALVYLLRIWQADRCAICGERGSYAECLVLDHDHETGWVRGYLCRSCNSSEGQGRRGGPFPKYRERNPASMFGIATLYYSQVTGWARPMPNNGLASIAERSDADAFSAHYRVSTWLVTYFETDSS